MSKIAEVLFLDIEEKKELIRLLGKLEGHLINEERKKNV